MKELTSDLLNRIRKDPNSVNWDYICYSYELSEDFIREFQYMVYWYRISVYQKLSEDFMREFQDRVDWAHIAKHQKLSEEFLVEFIDKIGLFWLEVNKNVPKDVFERIKLLKGAIYE
jgi:hypothetical protein